MMAFKLTSGDDGLIVVGQYAPEVVHGSTWIIGVTLLEEDKLLPEWHMRYETFENGYSPSLIIECPDDVEIVDISTLEANNDE